MQREVERKKIEPNYLPTKIKENAKTNCMYLLIVEQLHSYAMLCNVEISSRFHITVTQSMCGRLNTHKSVSTENWKAKAAKLL